MNSALFCKRVKNTSFVVDGFQHEKSVVYKGKPPTHFFLSHFHSDHTVGLKNGFSKSIVCSMITKRLLVSLRGIKNEIILAAEPGETIVIEKISITLIDANHCPGTVMFLFEFPSGKKILHSGDCRFAPKMFTDNPRLLSASRNISTLYLDTTYCSPRSTFPPQVSDITVSFLFIFIAGFRMKFCPVFVAL
jgi:DNA cross-link repair 1A protein